MKLKRYDISETIEPAALIEIEDELRTAYQVIMKFGHPYGKPGREYLMVYALYNEEGE